MGSRRRRAHRARSDDVDLQTLHLSHSSNLPSIQPSSLPLSSADGHDRRTYRQPAHRRQPHNGAYAHLKAPPTHTAPRPARRYHPARDCGDPRNAGLRKPASPAQDRPGQMHSWPRPRLTQAVSRGHVHQCRASTRRQAVPLRTRSVPQWCFVAPQLGGARDQGNAAGASEERRNITKSMHPGPRAGEQAGPMPPRAGSCVLHGSAGAAVADAMHKFPLCKAFPGKEMRPLMWASSVRGTWNTPRALCAFAPQTRRGRSRALRQPDGASPAPACATTLFVVFGTGSAQERSDGGRLPPLIRQAAPCVPGSCRAATLRGRGSGRTMATSHANPGFPASRVRRRGREVYAGRWQPGVRAPTATRAAASLRRGP